MAPRTVLPVRYDASRLEAGVDEVGRGSLAGPVVAAAVIFGDDVANDPSNPRLALIQDSKMLSARQRREARKVIEDMAIAWGVAEVAPQEIDRSNITRATLRAMHKALDIACDRLATTSKRDLDGIIVDGTYFQAFIHPQNGEFVPHACIPDGDAKYMSIAAASVIAKTHRDDLMSQLHEQWPHYGFGKHFGYGTPEHYAALREHGPCLLHRMSFRLGV